MREKTQVGQYLGFLTVDFEAIKDRKSAVQKSKQLKFGILTSPCEKEHARLCSKRPNEHVLL